MAYFTWSCNAGTGVVTFNAGGSKGKITSYYWNYDFDSKTTKTSVTTVPFLNQGSRNVYLLVIGPGGTSDPYPRVNVHCGP